MSIFNGGESRVLRELGEEIERELRRLGLLYRLFSRVKSERSMADKIERKGYARGSGKIRDIFGFRVVLYFADDVKYVERLVERLFKRVESTIDSPGSDVFGPTRYNLVCRLPEWAMRSCGVDWRTEFVEPMFEIQIRSVLSEGWHEVEHDLRYKAPGDWASSGDLSRTMNGFLATVETCEWGMLQLFDELAWRHYKTGCWDAMLRAKFRLRLTVGDLSSEVGGVISQDASLQKGLFKMSRVNLLEEMQDQLLDFPMVLDNLCFVANRLGGFSVRLREYEPIALQSVLSRVRLLDTLNGRDH